MKIVIFIVLFAVSLDVWSATHSHTGKIVTLRSHTSYWGSDTWIQVEGINGIENCEQNNHGSGHLTYIVIPSEEKQLYSLVLSAYMAEKEIVITFDDVDLTHGLCTVRFITVN